MHPMFVKLFIDTDDEQLAEDEDKRRRTRRLRSNRSAMVVRAAARGPDRRSRP